MRAALHEMWPRGAWDTLSLEGVRLFFPLAASYAIVMPLAWVIVFGFRLPFAMGIPASQWHAHEMIFGVLGAALAGFLTSAVPEWTDTARLQGRALRALAYLWLPGRVIGLLGLGPLVIVAALTDSLFLAGVLRACAAPMIARRSTKHASIAVWAAVLLATEIACRAAWMSGDFALSARVLNAAMCVFAILLALSTSRVNVVVVNLALDPSGESTPYRPHPGRQNLASGMVAGYAVAATCLPESAVASWLALAAGAAFLDRLAEWFIGRAALRADVLALAGANALAGIGFFAIGAAGLGAPFSAHAGLHLVGVGALGLATLAIFSIAGLRHTGHALVLPWQAQAAFALVVAAAALRTLPELAGWPVEASIRYAGSSLVWSAAFALWLSAYLPILATVDDASHQRC